MILVPCVQVLGWQRIVGTQRNVPSLLRGMRGLGGRSGVILGCGVRVVEV